MAFLISGLLLWAVVHFTSALLPAFRAGVIERAGLGAWKGPYALLVLTGLVLIVIGWRSSLPVAVYLPPAWGADVTFLFMLAAIFLFRAAHAKSNVKRIVRHPQLTGLVLWSVGHLLSNGDSRSLVLFGTLGLWALVEMPLINRRDGAWVKPAPVPARQDVIGVAIAAVVFAMLVFLHPYFAGVSPLAAVWQA